MVADVARKIGVRPEGYVLWASLGQIRAVIEQMRNPIVHAPWIRRAAFVLLMVPLFPFTLLAMVLGIPLKLLCGRQRAVGVLARRGSEVARLNRQQLSLMEIRAPWPDQFSGLEGLGTKQVREATTGFPSLDLQYLESV
jgi:hypothetical protein